MTRKHHKIEIATPEDVAKYAEAQPAAAGATGSSPASASPSGATGGSSAGAPTTGGQETVATPSPEVEALRAEAEQWKDKCLRAKAELANFQRRNNQERAEAIKFANAEFARGLLNVVDDLERALAHVGDVSSDADAVVAALKLIYGNFMKVLREHHVEPIEAAGLAFDPACHQALMERPSDEHPEPIVLEVLQKGYRLYDRVLRPAKVVISKAPEKSASQGSDAQTDSQGEQGRAGS
jgi:molecular chaperone GrpE